MCILYFGLHLYLTQPNLENKELEENCLHTNIAGKALS